MGDNSNSSTAFFTGNVIKAKYYEQDNPANQGNPYLEALPLQISDVKIGSLIERPLAYGPDIRLKPALDRLEYVKDINNCIVPLPDHIMVFRKICVFRAIATGIPI